MTGKSKSLVVMLFSLVFAASMLFVSFANPVWAANGDDDGPHKKQFLLKANSMEDNSEDTEPEEGTNVHADPATFEKNFELSMDQKESTIQKTEEIVAKSIKPGMSDLEKYYTLAIEANKVAKYDWDFWNGAYNFDLYSHQWDSYGVLNERSVCVGIAIFYSQLCHAADLPCWFVRIDPSQLDHTISYIPDINGNAYYVDVTENFFLMSEKSNPFKPIDKDFSHITKECTDTTFDYAADDGESYNSTDIKECYDITFNDWFKEFALHEDTDKNFPTAYVEKGNGPLADDTNRYHVSYHDYRSNFVENTDVWFLDDYYRDSASLKTKILNNEFDEQLLDVSGIKKNYDCASKADLEAAIEEAVSAGDISVKYFPSSENGEVVAKSAVLENGTDYKITCTSYDETSKSAVITVQGTSAYSGSYQIPVKLNSAVIDKAPTPKRGLVYNENPQVLVNPGKAEGGEIQYGLGTKNTAPDEFSADIPTATDAGKYYVWYKAVGAEGHGGTEPQCMGSAVSIAPKQINIIIDEKVAIRVGEKTVLTPELDEKIPAVFTFTCSDDEEAIFLTENGEVTGLTEGSATIYVECKLKYSSQNYAAPDDAIVVVRVGSKNAIDIEDTRVVLSQSDFTYNGKVQKPSILKIKRRSLQEGRDYTATWSNASSTDAGTYTVTIVGTGEYFGTTDATYTISKAKNPMTLKGKTVKVKKRHLKKKSKSIKQTKAFKISNAKGDLSYKLVSAKKGKKSFKKKFKVNPKTGTVTVKKKLKKGTYKVKVKVKAAGTANYAASAWKTVTFKVRVK